MSPQFILAVAAGGAIGSVARYLVGIASGKLFGLAFPWGTLIINILGSFMIGVFVELFALRWVLPPESFWWWAFAEASRPSRRSRWTHTC
jgi:fluoride exporter